MRAWAKILVWIGVGLLGLGLILFVIGPVLFASVAYPLPKEYQDALCKESAANGISPNFLAGLIYTESHWNPSARSGSGAQGLTQFTQSTARAEAERLGISPFQPSDLINNPNLAIKFGADYIHNAVVRYGGDKRKALIAYNGGGGAVVGYEKGYPFSGTLAYANKVLATEAMYDQIYGDYCNWTALPDLSGKSKNPTELITTLSIPDFWKNLLFNTSPSLDTSASNPIVPPDQTSSFWKNLLGN